MSRADDLIERLQAEIVKRDSRVADLEAQLEDTEERRENAARNSSAFEDRMGALQVENGKLQARIVELEAPMLAWAELDYTKHTRRSLMCYIGQQNFRITAQENQLAALKAQQPSAGVVLPPSPYMPGVEPDQLSDYERGEAQGRCDMWAEVARLNPCRAQAVPDGLVMVPVQMTDAMRDAGNVHTLNRATLCRIWADMLASAPSAQQGKENDQ